MSLRTSQKNCFNNSCLKLASQNISCLLGHDLKLLNYSTSIFKK
jgi:hypothetical protein